MRLQDIVLAQHCYYFRCTSVIFDVAVRYKSLILRKIYFFKRKIIQHSRSMIFFELTTVLSLLHFPKDPPCHLAKCPPVHLLQVRCTLVLPQKEQCLHGNQQKRLQPRRPLRKQQENWEYIQYLRRKLGFFSGPTKHDRN